MIQISTLTSPLLKLLAYRSGLFIAIALSGIAHQKLAYADTSSESPNSSLRTESHLLEWNGHPVFEFREKLGSISAGDRLSLARLHLETAVKNTTPPISEHVRFVATPHSIDFYIDERPIFSLFDQDASGLRLQKEWLATQVLGNLKTALSAGPSTLKPLPFGLSPWVWAALYFVGYLLVVAFLLQGFGVAFRTLDRWKTSAAALRIARYLRYFSSDRIFNGVSALLGLARFSSIAIATYLTIPLVLSVFPWGATYAPKLLALILDPIKEVATVAIAYLPNLFFIAVIVFFTRMLLKISHWFFDEIGRGTIRFSGFHTDWAEPTYQLGRILILAFSLIVIFPYLPGAGSPAFQSVSVFIGVLISFGSSSAISNAIAGFVLTYMRPFQPGDFVKIGGTTGNVVEKGILVTRIRTIKNVDITIPNSAILGNHIENFSTNARAKLLILNSTITIGYDAPWKLIHELLIQSAKRTPRILENPTPFVLQTALNDFTVSYQINAYTDDASLQMDTYSALHAAIQDEFARAGVEIMSPQYLSIRNGNDTMLPKSSDGPDGHTRAPFEVHTVNSQ